MFKIIRRISRGDKGQSLVELALILPMILLLLIGVVEFGRIFHTYLIITQGSREGARLAVVGGSNTAIENRIQKVAASLDFARMMVEITPGEKERIRGTPVIVTIQYNLELIIPDIMNIFPEPFVISSTTVMRME